MINLLRLFLANHLIYSLNVLFNNFSRIVSDRSQSYTLDIFSSWPRGHRYFIWNPLFSLIFHTLAKQNVFIHKYGTKKNLSPHEESNLRPSPSNALLLIYQDSMVSKAHYKVHIWHASYLLLGSIMLILMFVNRIKKVISLKLGRWMVCHKWINNVDSIMFVNRVRKVLSLKLGREMVLSQMWDKKFQSPWRSNLRPSDSAFQHTTTLVTRQKTSSSVSFRA